MKEKGYYYTGAQLSNKWKSIKREYKSTVDHNLKSGNSRKTCKFFDQLNNIYDTKPSTKPACVLDSSSGTSSNLEESIQDVNSEQEERTGEPPHKKQKQNTPGPGRKIRKKRLLPLVLISWLGGWIAIKKNSKPCNKNKSFWKKKVLKNLKEWTIFLVRNRNIIIWECMKVCKRWVEYFMLGLKTECVIKTEKEILNANWKCL